MHKFSSRTLLIFVIGLLLAVILLGLGTAYVSNLKQQRRQLSDNSLFDCAARAAPPAKIWLGREGSNLRMVESKSTALPLGDAPIA